MTKTNKCAADVCFGGGSRTVKICCEFCMKYWHLRCGNLSSALAKSIRESPGVCWLCPSCRDPENRKVTSNETINLILQRTTSTMKLVGAVMDTLQTFCRMYSGTCGRPSCSIPRNGAHNDPNQPGFQEQIDDLQFNLSNVFDSILSDHNKRPRTSSTSRPSLPQREKIAKVDVPIPHAVAVNTTVSSVSDSINLNSSAAVLSTRNSIGNVQIADTVPHSAAETATIITAAANNENAAPASSAPTTTTMQPERTTLPALVSTAPQATNTTAPHTTVNTAPPATICATLPASTTTTITASTSSQNYTTTIPAANSTIGQFIFPAAAAVPMNGTTIHSSNQPGFVPTARNNPRTFSYFTQSDNRQPAEIPANMTNSNRNDNVSNLGSTPNHVLPSLAVAPPEQPQNWFYVTRFHPHETTENLIQFIKSRTNCDPSAIRCLKLVRQDRNNELPLSFVSFKLCVPEQIENLITADNFWPPGVSISTFFGKRPVKGTRRFLEDPRPNGPPPDYQRNYRPYRSRFPATSPGPQIWSPVPSNRTQTNRHVQYTQTIPRTSQFREYWV